MSVSRLLSATNGAQDRGRLVIHRHRWAFRALEHANGTFLGLMTVLLYRCEVCGKTKTETVNGLWTKEQIGVSVDNESGDQKGNT